MGYKPIVCATALLLLACARPVTTEAVRSDGLSQTFDNCLVKIDFSGVPTAREGGSLRRNTALVDRLSFSTRTLSEWATCECFIDTELWSTPSDQRIANLRADLESKNVTVTAIEFSPSSTLGQTLEWSGTLTLTTGAMSSIFGKLIYLPTCTFNATGSTLDRNEVALPQAFVRSIRLREISPDCIPAKREFDLIFPRVLEVFGKRPDDPAARAQDAEVALGTLDSLIGDWTDVDAKKRCLIEIMTAAGVHYRERLWIEFVRAVERTR